MRLFKIKNNYYIRTTISGKDCKISLKTKDESIALERFKDIEKQKAILPINEIRIYTSKLVNGVFKPIKKEIIQAHTLALSQFLDFAKSKKIVMTSQITEQVTCEYRDNLAQNNFAPATIRTHIMSLSSIFRSNGVYSNFVRKHCPIVFKATEKGIISNQEIENCIIIAKRANKLELAALFMIAYYTGMRLSDIALLKKEEVTPSKIIKTLLKTGVKIEIPIHKKLKLLFEKKRLSRSIYFFPTSAKSYLKHRSSNLSKQLNSIISQVVGERTELLPHRKRRFSKISFHSIRHAFVLKLVKAQVPLIVIHKLTGMSTDLIIKRYANHFSSSEISKIYNTAMENIYE